MGTFTYGDVDRRRIKEKSDEVRPKMAESKSQRVRNRLIEE